MAEKLVVYNSMEEANTGVEEYILKNGNIRFVVAREQKDFGTSDKILDFIKKRSHMYWKTRYIPFSGKPFVCLGNKMLICHQGRDSNKAQKVKMKQELSSNPKHQRKFACQSKKVGCPAGITLTHFAEFSGFKLDYDTKRRKNEITSAIRELIDKDITKLKFKSKFTVMYPPAKCHIGHCVEGLEADSRHIMDPLLVQKVQELFDAGVDRAYEVRKQLQIFVKGLFGSNTVPDKSERRWHPTIPDLEHYLHIAKRRTMFSVEDYDELNDFVSSYNEDNFFYCRVASEDEPFILLFQTEWQKRLMHRYGSTVLLDATYRTTEHALPVYFMAVKTNTNFVIVAMFIIDGETTDKIKEALELFKANNRTWQPFNFMVGLKTTEIDALEEVFPAAKVYICDFYREKAWLEWIRKDCHDVATHENFLMSNLKKLASSVNQESYNSSLKDVLDSEVWTSQQILQDWFQLSWLSMPKKWVRMYRDSYMPINTTNGIRRLHMNLMKKIDDSHRDWSMLEFVKMLITNFFPDMFAKYCQENILSTTVYKKYADQMPDFLNRRPRKFVSHVMKRLESTLAAEFVCDRGNGLFDVIDDKEGEKYKVWFGSEDLAPFCECSEWSQLKLPCKHMTTVWKHTHWRWEDLYFRYRDSPWFSLDDYVISNAPPLLVQNTDAKTSLMPCTVILEEDESHPEEAAIELHGAFMNVRSKCAKEAKKLLDMINKESDINALEKMHHQISAITRQASFATKDASFTLPTSKRHSPDINLKLSDAKRGRLHLSSNASISSIPSITVDILQTDPVYSIYCDQS